jgi:hypothetical protein
LIDNKNNIQILNETKISISGGMFEGKIDMLSSNEIFGSYFNALYSILVLVEGTMFYRDYNIFTAGCHNNFFSFNPIQ